MSGVVGGGSNRREAGRWAVWLRRLCVWPLVLLVRIYQGTLSPVVGRQCRYVPTCSNYAIDALNEFGPIKGSWLALRRVLRCHPFARGGYDPAPIRGRGRFVDDSGVEKGSGEGRAR
ncbi:MAG: membrane protein insertion efficiency factor YidD [Phycisphaerales bacterium]